MPSTHQPVSGGNSAADRDQEWAKQVIHRTYLPHIDGLRCLAVIPVVLYHLFSPLCPGGFVGVDIFFVISGYLICGGILNDLKKGTFSLTSFYHRRIRRIFPAYFTLVASTLLLGVLLYHWARLVPLAQTALFSALFSTNFYFALVIGYFQPTANENSLLHLWTLSVEEQFYIIIPVLTLVLWRFKHACVKPVLLLLFFLSLVACVLLGQGGNSNTSFYMLPTRAWELLAGALLANLPPSPKSLHGALLSILGLAFILLTFWGFTTLASARGVNVQLILPFIGKAGIYPFPGYATIPVIAGSLALLRYGDTGPLSHLLCSRPFTGIGKISYSLYLWHWPIIVFARYISYDRQSSLDLVVVFFLSLLAAYLSWRWVEMPVRRSQQFTPRMAFISTGMGCAILGASCVLLISTEGLRHLIHIKANSFAAAPRPFMLNLKKVFRDPPFNPPAYPSIDANYVMRLGESGQKPTFCLLGDSHAEAVEPGLDRVAAEHHQAGFYMAMLLKPGTTDHSTGMEQKIEEWIAANPDIHDIYLAGRWLTQYNVTAGLPDLGDKGHISPVVLDPELSKTVEANLRHTAQWFIQHGKRVYVFNTVPEYEYSPTDVMARSQIIPLSLSIGITRQDHLNRQKPLAQILAKLEDEGLITVVPLDSALLTEDSALFMSDDGAPYYKDNNHLTPEAAYLACEAIASVLWPDKPANK